ncbi:hypothetical protein [Enterococcus larvae]|uniref:hypothetical protein n=1 Tax=Enterococcus larvae TaxID=2794352 RepID=UPI003F406D5D
MIATSTAERISMAQAVLVSLIESHKDIEPCEIEDNLVAINSFLIDASLSCHRNSVTSKSNHESISTISILEDVAAELVENTSLLEFIFRNSPDSGETDNHLSCLIRSMQKTCDKAYEYINNYDYNIEDNK